MNTNAPSNTDDVIDSRQIIDRIVELTEELADMGALSDEEADELDALTKLAEEASDYAPDWEYGETLIRRSYFQDYAMDLARDIAPTAELADIIEGGGGWPYNCIDWEQAARELAYDYTTVDFDGVDYYIRSC